MLSPKGRFVVGEFQLASLPPGAPAGNPRSTWQDAIPKAGGCQGDSRSLNGGNAEHRGGDGGAIIGFQRNQTFRATSPNTRWAAVDVAQHDAVEDAGRRSRAKSGTEGSGRRADGIQALAAGPRGTTIVVDLTLT